MEKAKRTAPKKKSAPAKKKTAVKKAAPKKVKAVAVAKPVSKPVVASKPAAPKPIVVSAPIGLKPAPTTVVKPVNTPPRVIEIKNRPGNEEAQSPSGLFILVGIIIVIAVIYIGAKVAGHRKDQQMPDALPAPVSDNVAPAEEKPEAVVINEAPNQPADEALKEEAAVPAEEVKPEPVAEAPAKPEPVAAAATPAPQPTASVASGDITFLANIGGTFGRYNLKGELVEKVGDWSGDGVYVPDQKAFYQTTGKGVRYYVGATKDPVLVEATGVPQLIVPSAIGYDTKRGRVIVATSGGVGNLYAYTPSTQAWELLTSMRKVDATGISYDETTDQYVIAEPRHFAGGGYKLALHFLDAGHATEVKNVLLSYKALPEFVNMVNWDTNMPPEVKIASANGNLIVMVAETNRQSAKIYLYDVAKNQAELTNASAAR